MKSSLFKPVALILSALITALLLSGCQGKKNDAEAIPVTKQDLSVRINLPGQIIPNRKSVMTAPYRGYVRKIYVQNGAKIREGDPVVSVATSLSPAEPVHPLRAPFSGQVTQVNKAEGEFVTEGNVQDFLVRIDDLSKLWIEGSIPEIDRANLRIGADALVRPSALPTVQIKAIVRDVAGAAKDRDRWESSTAVQFPVRIEILEKNELLRPGMTVLVEIVADKREGVLTVPHEVLEIEGLKSYVTLVGGERREVKIGLRNESMVEVLEGLQESDKVLKVDWLAKVK